MIRRKDHNVNLSLPIWQVRNYPDLERAIGIGSNHELLMYWLANPLPSLGLDVKKLIKRAEQWVKVLLSNQTPAQLMFEWRLENREVSYAEKLQPIPNIHQPDLYRLDVTRFEELGAEKYCQLNQFLTIKSNYTNKQYQPYSREDYFVPSSFLQWTDAELDRELDKMMICARFIEKRLQTGYSLTPMMRDQVLDLYYRFLNPGSRSSLRDIPETANVQNYLLRHTPRPNVSGGVNHDGCTSINISMTEFPIEVNVPEIDDLGYLRSSLLPFIEGLQSIPYTLSIKVEKIEKKEGLRNLTKLRKAAEAKEGTMEHGDQDDSNVELKKESIGGEPGEEGEIGFSRALELDVEAYMRIRLDCQVAHSDPVILNQMVSDAKTAFDNFGAKTFDTENGQAAVGQFLRALPPGGDFFSPLPTAPELPVRASKLCVFPHFAGNFYGEPGSNLVIKVLPDNYLTTLNMWSGKFPNKHILVYGDTGEGKTYLIGSILRADIIAGVRVLAVDWANSLYRLAGFTNNSTYFEAGPEFFADVLSIFNPLKVSGDKYLWPLRVSQVFSCLRDMIGKKPDRNLKVVHESMSDEQEVYLYRALQKYLGKEYVDKVCIQRFHDFLKNKEKSRDCFEEDTNFHTRCGVILEKYLTFPFLSTCFDPGQTKPIPLEKLEKSAFAVYNMRQLTKIPALKPIYMNIFSIIGSNRMHDERTKDRVSYDEGYESTNDALLEQNINIETRRGRGLNIGLLFGSHGPPRNPLLEEPMRMPHLKCFTKQGEGAIDDIHRILKPSKHQKGIIDQQMKMILSLNEYEPDRHPYALWLGSRDASVFELVDSKHDRVVKETDPTTVDDITDELGYHDDDYDGITACVEKGVVK